MIYKNLKTEPVNVHKTFLKHSAELVERVGKIKNKLDEQIFLFPILHIIDFLKSSFSEYAISKNHDMKIQKYKNSTPEIVFSLFLGFLLTHLNNGVY